MSKKPRAALPPPPVIQTVAIPPPATATAPPPPPAPVCAWCGGTHLGRCPEVRAMHYYPDGKLKRVEFHDPAHIAKPPPADGTGKP